ncbi:PIN domain-containing protein [Lysobacter sp. D1-1-M9]|uniref:PIN domain-containing protein n=1 Tax=Novilysobacter longmucuonensis TaxID=3098603 RepID=UPI002FCAF83C
MPRKVFIDASKIIQFGHSLDNAEARTIVELCELGLVRLVTTDLTVAEVAKRFAKVEFEKVQDICRPDFRDRAQRYLDIELPSVERDALRKKIFDQQLLRVNDFVKATKASVLSIDDVRPSQVLGDYTHARGLFSAASKKDQFPDAFIFAALVGALEADEKLIIHAQDKDFGPAVKHLPNVSFVDAFEGLLSELGISMVDESVFDLVEANANAFEIPIGEALKQYIIHADDVEDGEMEVSEVGEVELDISRVYGAWEDTYLVYGTVSCKATVDYSHPDWESAIYDSEDKVLIPFGSVSGEAEVDLDKIPFSFEVEVDPDDKSLNVSAADVRGHGFITATLHPREWW